jgi:dihydrolipoamide dehydrogenase
VNQTTASDNFDLVVIGAGPGGYVAAIRAAQLGLKAAIVERENLGGICLNWGCIPTKALLKSAEVYAQLAHLADYGLAATGTSFDFPKVIERSRKVAAQLNAGIGFLMKKHKVSVVEGTARLEAGKPAPRVQVALRSGGTRALVARNVILATGARARTIPAAGMVPNGRSIWTYREAMTPKQLPKSLLVIGSGAIGLEFASFYRSFGTAVTVIESLERILPVEDAEVSAAAQKAFEKRGMQFRVAARVERVAVGEGGVQVSLQAGGKIELLSAEAVLVAVGIEGNVENLGLEALGVKLDRGHVLTGAHSATNVPGLFAIGDVAGAPWLAHKASHEAVHCVEHIAGRPAASAYSPIPGCTYTHPQVASVGLTEAQAKQQGHELKVGRFPLRANGKAIAAGEVEGFVKTVFDARTGQLLGAHMFGAEVTEMIQGYVVAMTLESTEAELMSTVFPHPTISESMHESVLDAFGRVLHI